MIAVRQERPEPIQKLVWLALGKKLSRFLLICAIRSDGRFAQAQLIISLEWSTAPLILLSLLLILQSAPSDNDLHFLGLLMRCLLLPLGKLGLSLASRLLVDQLLPLDELGLEFSLGSHGAL